MSNSHPFNHFGKAWSIYKRASDGPDGAWYFSPRFGSHGQKVNIALRDKTTKRPLTRAEAEAEAKLLIEAHFKGPTHFEKLREDTRLRGQLTVGALLDHYVACRCPGRKTEPRTGSALAAEERQVTILKRWWDDKCASQVSEGDQDLYHKWRLTTVTKGTGNRTTQLELVVLKNALRWAVRSKKLDRMPLTQHYAFVDPKQVEHARKFMPRSGDEVHVLARAHFQSRDTEVYGWLGLLEAFTGLRDAEARQLLAAPQRADPLSKPPPGFMDTRYLHVVRVKNGKNPRIRLDDPERPEIRPLIERILAWKAARYPESRWLLPRLDGGQLCKGQHTKLLGETCARLGLPERHGHGHRAYYASVRLAQGTSTQDVATELGQGSGDELVRDVYGMEPDEFDEQYWKSLAPIFTWLPNTAGTAPAWEILNLPTGKIVNINQ